MDRLELVNLLLFGTSFTKQLRIRVEDITEASRSGTLRARVDDLVSGLVSPGDNERLSFLSKLLRSKGLDPAVQGETGVFIYNNLQRVLQERQPWPSALRKPNACRHRHWIARHWIARPCFGIVAFPSIPASFRITRSNRPCAI
jgi:hypothetical protein